MTYEEYLAQQQQAIDEEQSDDSCFLTEQPEGSRSAPLSQGSIPLC